MTEKFICFDIGGTKIFQAVVEINFAQRSFEFLDSKTIQNPINAVKIKEIILGYCDQNKKKFNTNKVAISSAKIVEGLKIFRASDVFEENEFGFGFLKKTGYQVIIENDGKAFSLGEYYFDKNEDVQGLLTLTIGSGIGGGFITSEGQILRGKDHSATEFSHMKMRLNREWKPWEYISAGRGIEELYQAKTSVLMKAKEIFENYEKDELAKEVIDLAQEYLGQGIAGLINFFNPEKFVFG